MNKEEAIESICSIIEEIDDARGDYTGAEHFSALAKKDKQLSVLRVKISEQQKVISEYMAKYVETRDERDILSKELEEDRHVSDFGELFFIMNKIGAKMFQMNAGDTAKWFSENSRRCSRFYDYDSELITYKLDDE